MAADERARQELHRRLEEVLGVEQALTLMAYQPHGEPATKEDLGTLEQHLSQRMDHLEQRIDLKIELMAQRCETALHQGLSGLRTEMVSQTRLLFFSMIGTMMTLATLVFAAVRLN